MADVTPNRAGTAAPNSGADSVATIDPADLLEMVGRHRWVAVGVFASFVLAAVIGTLLIAPRYVATAGVSYSRSPDIQSAVLGTIPDSMQRSDVMQSLVAEVYGDNAASSIRSGLAAKGWTHADFSVAADVGLHSGAQMLVASVPQYATITVVSEDPEVAAYAANAYASYIVDQQREQSRVLVANAVKAAQDQLGPLRKSLITASRLGASVRDVLLLTLLPKEQQLEQRLFQLKNLAANISANFTLAQAAKTPSRNTRSRWARNGAMGSGVGLVAGLLTAFAVGYLDDRGVARRRVVSLLGGGRLLGSLRHGDVAARPGDGAAPDAPVPNYEDLASALDFTLEALDVHVLLVTSVSAAADRAIAVRGVGMALGGAGRAVALVDADLDAAGLGLLLGFEDQPGLAEAVAGGSNLDQLLREVEVPGGGSLIFLPAGCAAAHSKRALQTAKLQGVLTDLAERADIVLVNAPELVEFSESAVLSTIVDAMVVVADPAMVSRNQLREAAWRIDRLACPNVGLVVVERA